jgi:hypothetical protein
MLSLKIKTFYLNRITDISGMSGTGIIAVGVVYPNGEAHMLWTSFKSSFELHKSVDALLDIHGHNGATQLIWGDPPCSDDRPVKKLKKKE